MSNETGQLQTQTPTGRFKQPIQTMFITFIHSVLLSEIDNVNFI